MQKIKNPYKSFIAMSLFFLLIAGCQRDRIIITGSETMYPMLKMLARDYNEIQEDYRVVVKGGGSLLGLKRLILRQTDFAASSHEIERAIQDQLASIDDYKIVVVAFDGIALVVNKKNPVIRLHLKQASDIFAGRIKTWKEVGGRDKIITVLIRNDNSGTASYMKEHILRLKDLGELIYAKNRYVEYTRRACTVKNNREMAQIISENENAIGYMGMGSAVTEGRGKVKKLRYSIERKGPYYEPDIKTVQNGQYQLARPLSLVYKPDSNGPKDKFIDYVNTKRAQLQVESSGYLDSLYKDLFIEPLSIKGEKSD